MPPVRKLAYKDRFVWQLQQEISGASSSEAPLSFSPDEQTVFVLSLNQTEWNEIFSSLLNGADLTYPEKSHEVVWHLLKQVEYPMTLPPPAGNDSTLTLWSRFADMNFTPVYTANTNQPFAHYHQAPGTGAVNQIMQWVIHPTPGFWNVQVLYVRQGNSGIVTIGTVDESTGVDTPRATFDANGSFLANQLATTSFTLTASTPQTLYLQARSKAPASGGYLFGITAVNLWRSD